MIFVVWPLLPFFQSGLLCAHEQLYPVSLDRSNCTIRDVAIFGEKESFVYQKRILVNLSYMSQVLIIGRVDMHVFVKVMLAPLWHGRLSFCIVCLVYSFSRSAVEKSFTVIQRYLRINSISGISLTYQ